MGLNVGSVYSANPRLSIIDSQALKRVSEQILNPNNQKNVDVSKLDLSKFNRVNIGTDLYAQRTSGQTALEISKAAVDFDLNLSQSFSAKVQYLNSQAAQSLFSVKENQTNAAISIDNMQQIQEKEIILASTQVAETNSMNKDKRGSNPFSFYASVDGEQESEDSDINLSVLNFFA